MPDRASTSPPAGPRILLCGWAGAGNVGDELLTRAMVEVLHEAGATVVVASRDPRATEAQHRGVEAIPWGVRGWNQLGHVDGVCVGPGGILQDSSSIWNLPGHLLLAWRARSRGAAVAAVGVGAEPLRRRSSALLLRRVLAGVPVVTRDAASSAALEASGLTPVTSVDLVFGLAPPIVEPRPEIVVAIGPSTRPGRVVPASRRLDPAPTSKIARGVGALAARLDCRVVLTSFRGERDRVAAKAVADRLEVDCEILEADIDEHVRHVSTARVVVSSRYHPIVVAAASGTPVLAVSSQPKIASLVTQIDEPQIRKLPDWDALLDASLSPERFSPRVPSGLDIAHRALDKLVEAGRAPRTSHRGG